jgi:ppGpp synthetase/RelA/SpoT-type nucleotidyltranferase
MTLLSISEIEQSLLPFRCVRRLVLDKLLQKIVQGEDIVNPFLMLSRLFGRLKSADSILEKIERKGIIIADGLEISEKIPDMLGFRIITVNIDELYVIDRFINEQFEIISRQDQVTQPDEFGNREIKYSLRYHFDSVAYPFEIQLRTFLQHYWASQSFHLFHKKPREIALKHRDDLLSLSHALEQAERAASRLFDNLPASSPSISSAWGTLPFRTQVNLVVIECGEQFAAHLIQPLSGNDQRDHDNTVGLKRELYSAYPGSAIVECSCLHFLSFVLNEPHVWVPVDRLKNVVL